jgi:hypothetical protein
MVVREKVERIFEEINKRKEEITLSEVRELFKSVGFEEVTPEHLSSTLNVSLEEAKEFLRDMMRSRESVAGNLVFSSVTPHFFFRHQESDFYVIVEYDYVLSRGVFTGTYYTADDLRHSFKLLARALILSKPE